MSMESYRLNGANLPRKKLYVITLLDEHTVLSHACTNPMYPCELQYHVVYYLLRQFTIREGNELYKIGKDKITFGEENEIPFISYDKRLSKNYKVF